MSDVGDTKELKVCNLNLFCSTYQTTIRNIVAYMVTEKLMLNRFICKEFSNGQYGCLYKIKMVTNDFHFIE
jgi:hypothetical protein